MMRKIALVPVVAVCLLSFALVGCTKKPQIAIPAQQPAEVMPKKPPRVALVLGGGGARGIAHVGVIKVLEEAGVPIDMVVGASAGSIVGSLYADDPNADHLKQVLMHATAKDFVDISFLHILGGPISGKNLQRFIFTHVKARDFKDLKLKFVAVSTDLQTGKVYPLAAGPIAPAINASSALPPFFHPVELYGRTLVDGGVVDSIPVNVARRYNPRFVIAVDIEEGLAQEMPESIFGVFLRSFKITVAELGKLRASIADIVLYPNVGDVGTFDEAAKPKMFAAGEAAARKALPKIKAMLAARGIALKPQARPRIAAAKPTAAKPGAMKLPQAKQPQS